MMLLWVNRAPRRGLSDVLKSQVHIKALALSMVLLPIIVGFLRRGFVYVSLVILAQVDAHYFSSLTFHRIIFSRRCVPFLIPNPHTAWFELVLLSLTNYRDSPSPKKHPPSIRFGQMKKTEDRLLICCSLVCLFFIGELLPTQKNI